MAAAPAKSHSAAAAAPAEAGRPLSAATVAPVPGDILDALRPLSRQQLDNMLTNYYHRVRGAARRCGSNAMTTENFCLSSFADEYRFG